MNFLFKDIKAVGFDLDNTLYPNNPLIDDLIRNKIAEKILEKKISFLNRKNVRKFYDKEYEKIGSWTKILGDIGFKNPKKVMYECISNPRILDFIQRDEKLIKIMEKISAKYYSFLITSGPKDISLSKLEKIGLNLNLFNFYIFGDSIESSPKADGKNFYNLIKQSSYKPSQHVYIGDNLKADILPAKAKGMKTIAVGNKISEADYSVKEIYEISKLLI